jgi:hypothetical protein
MFPNTVNYFGHFMRPHKVEFFTSIVFGELLWI